MLTGDIDLFRKCQSNWIWKRVSCLCVENFLVYDSGNLKHFNGLSELCVVWLWAGHDKKLPVVFRSLGAPVPFSSHTSPPPHPPFDSPTSPCGDENLRCRGQKYCTLFFLASILSHIVYLSAGNRMTSLVCQGSRWSLKSLRKTNQGLESCWTDINRREGLKLYIFLAGIEICFTFMFYYTLVNRLRFIVSQWRRLQVTLRHQRHLQRLACV